MGKYNSTGNAFSRYQLLFALIAFGSTAIVHAGQEPSAPLAGWSFDSLEASGSAPSTNSPFRFVEGVLDKSTIMPFVLQVDGQNRVVETHEFQLTGDSNIVKTAEGTWKLSTSFKPVAGHHDAVDAEFTWTLIEGNATSTAVAVAFDFEDWSSQNFVFAPASVYNGNRFDVKNIGWPTYLLFTDKREHRIDMPTTINQIPRLEKQGAGKIELDTGNVSTPLLGFQSPDQKKGWIVQTTQGSRFGNHGLTIEEDAEQNHARFMITLPAIRERRAASSTLESPSGDRAPDWKTGDSATIRCRIYTFQAPTVSDFLTRFASARKDLNPSAKNKTLPFSEAFTLLESLYRDHRWDEDAALFRLNDPGQARMVQIWQLGWVGGGQATLPLLQTGNEESRKRSLRNLETIFSKSQANSGFFYTLGDGETFTYDQFRPPVPPSMGLLRKNADWLYMAQRHFEVMEASGDTVPSRWLEQNRKQADAFVRLWNDYGQFGQWVDLESGELLVGNSTSAAIASGGLALASKRYGHKPYLHVAEEAGRAYYRDYVLKGYTTGGPGEALSCPDSESAFALLEAYLALYEVTNSQEWLDYAQQLLPICASWVVSYDVEFPKESPLGRAGAKTCGSVVASVQNKHSAPGICTWSGDSLLKLYRATGNPVALDLLTDIAHGITQYISREDRPLARMKAGGICERVNTSDWEGKNKVGGGLFSSCSWSETAVLLTTSQIPGIYVQPDTGVVAVFDHIVVEKISHHDGVLTLRLTNPTSFNAQTTVFIESSEDAKKSKNSFTIKPLPTIMIDAGASIEKEFILTE